MKLGLTSYAYAWAIGIAGFPAPAIPMDASALVRRAAELDLQVVQLCDNLPLLALDATARRALAIEAKKLGIDLEVGGRGLTARNLEDHLALAKDLDAGLVRFVIDGPGYHPALADMAALVREATPGLERRGLVLALENHDRFKARELAALIAGIGSSRVGVCLDTANSLGAGEGFATVLESLGDLAVNLHVKDVVVERFPHMLGFTVKGCAAGRGVVGPELPTALARLRAGGRCGSCLIEAWPEPGPDLAETLGREHAWAVESVKTLRGLLSSQS